MGSPPRQSRAASIFLLLVALGIIAYMAYPYIRIAMHGGMFPPHAVSLSEAQKHCSLRFPPGTRLRHGQIHEVAGESGLFALVEMRPTDAERFVRRLPSPRTVSRTDRFGIADPGWRAPRWWNPERPRRFIAVRVGAAGERFRPILLISLDDPSTTVAYVFCEGG